MHGFGQTISNGIVAMVITVIGVVLAFLMLSENSQQQSANSIVQTALMDASDNNAKAVDGTLVIDPDRFEHNLQQSNIDNWRKVANRKSKADMALGIYYLDDTSKTAQDYHRLEENQKSNKKAIKGVKVVIMRLVKTTPTDALTKLNAQKEQNAGNKQLGVTDGNKNIISENKLKGLSKDETVYLAEPTDIITYLVSGHGQLRNDDHANGIPKTTPDTNNRDNNADNYLNGYNG